MRILQVISSADPAGGGPIDGAIQLARLFQVSGHRTSMVTLDDPVPHWTTASDVDIHMLGPGWSKYRFAPRAVARLTRECKEFDCMIVHGLWQFHTPLARTAAACAGVPYLLFPHGMLDPYFQRTYPLKHAKKLVYWSVIERNVIRDAAAMLFTCEEERRLARTSFPGYEARDERVVSFGASPPAIEPRILERAFLERHTFLTGKRFLLFLGRIHEKKGCDLAITAFSRIASMDPDLVLVMAGPGDASFVLKLRSATQELGIAHRVVWTGMLTGDQKWGALAAADAFVLPSHQENFGIAVVEALAMGTPVLISNQVNIWREILADRAGLIADDNVHATAEILKAWVQFDIGARLAFRERAISSFRRRFVMRDAAARILNVAKEKLNRSLGP